MSDLQAMLELLKDENSKHWETLGLKAIIFFIVKYKESGQNSWENVEINGGDLVEVMANTFQELIDFIKERENDVSI